MEETASVSLLSFTHILRMFKRWKHEKYKLWSSGLCLQCRHDNYIKIRRLSINHRMHVLLCFPFMSKLPDCFLILITGQIESAEFSELPDIYLKFCFKYGPDWTVISGFEEGISQLCRVGNESDLFHINFPIEITFKSTNPFGWPQIVISCYGTDFLGNDVVRGYGATNLPLSPGSYKSRIPMFTPESSSIIQQFLGWVLGRRPELIDPTTIAQPEGRETMQVRTRGFLNISWNVVAKDVKRLGFDLNPRSLTTISEFPLRISPPSLPTLPVEQADTDQPQFSGTLQKAATSHLLTEPPSQHTSIVSETGLNQQDARNSTSVNDSQVVEKGDFERPMAIGKPDKPPRRQQKARVMDTVAEEITEERENT